ncbi:MULTISPECIES: GntR family transcriptional regulator [Clostridium]|nr:MULTISPECIES: GntR family transcriptional regulator [Clostridium]MCI1583000.1 GntR family transcriptional regulator [Clostridium beijerinckii]MCI1620874.1 GntR family transcriptional regulator [Clostridium beijerinckii]NOW32745.1 DNA-binding GntR family transcriptional regulator [Clostridium beijerinckii]NOW82298.1 DNA-binding GntR family transcriptional regulator [Clostridium beijerinckii]NRZ32595.1 DNA-binding GntR family transcriptional regulator [Clostridium beijerinckii]
METIEKGRLYMPPKYKVVYEDIKNKINNYIYKTNEKIPDGDSLAECYNCSKLTIAKALDLLVQEGMLIRRQGSGTYVKENLSNRTTIELDNISGYSKKFSTEHLKSTVIDFSIITPPKEIAEKLNITDEYIYKILRLRSVDNDPQILEETYMPIYVIPGLKEHHLEGSIYDYITNELGFKIQSAHISIKGDEANSNDKLYLNLTESDFIIELEKICYLENGKIFEYSKTHHRYDVFKFNTVLVNNI